MGAMETCCRVFLVLVNIFFLTIGLVFFALGLFIRFGTSVYEEYVDSVKESLQASATSSGFGTLDFSQLYLTEILMPMAMTIGLVFFALGLFIRFGTSVYEEYVDSVKESLQASATSSNFGTLDFSQFDLSEILMPMALGFIFFGLMMIVITVLGCCGSCYKIKFMLIVYVIVCLVLLVGQVVIIGILYGSPDTFHDPAKQKLKDGIQSDYMGLNGTNLVSLGWNVVMQKVECCGANDYSDFTGAPNWVIDYTNGYSPPTTLKTPLTCCMTLPSSTDFSCAGTGTATDSNNYQSTGCYKKIWDDTLGNSTIMIAALVSVGVFQILLIILGIYLLLAFRQNKTDDVKPHHPAQQQKGQKNQRPFKGNRRSPVVSPSSVNKHQGLKF